MPNQAIFFFVELQQKILENIFIIPKINTKTTLIDSLFFLSHHVAKLILYVVTYVSM